ncbi:pentapeptide repeat-containing protein [Chroococcidiopsis sp. CCMEE 29]|uniref:pentapeptide repeat-containing protein n=1 Tax=Chroococcidiopsis sp. CCMEE 29 TaxID=155894 RepID=UPI00202262DF|nr:pentapeptide repeat-containing protein [Chroococcidiopsis sp. CCMEE 29]
MKNLLRISSFLKDSFTSLNSWSSEKKSILLFDSSVAAEDIAFMLGGHWDECNGVCVPECDEVAVNTAASLVRAKWCYGGASCAFLTLLSVDELKRRYAAGDRNFANANLRCADLNNLNLSGANLGWAKLTLAGLSGANLSGADLTAADLSKANLSEADLRGANLSLADLREANLAQANLSGACLRGAKLTEAAGRSETILRYTIEQDG